MKQKNDFYILHRKLKLQMEKEKLDIEVCCNDDFSKFIIYGNIEEVSLYDEIIEVDPFFFVVKDFIVKNSCAIDNQIKTGFCDFRVNPEENNNGHDNDSILGKCKIHGKQNTKTILIDLCSELYRYVMIWEYLLDNTTKLLIYKHQITGYLKFHECYCKWRKKYL